MRVRYSYLAWSCPVGVMSSNPVRDNGQSSAATGNEIVRVEHWRRYRLYLAAALCRQQRWVMVTSYDSIRGPLSRKSILWIAFRAAV